MQEHQVKKKYEAFVASKIQTLDFQSEDFEPIKLSSQKIFLVHSGFNRYVYAIFRI